jgi:hypothetical protein
VQDRGLTPRSTSLIVPSFTVNTHRLIPIVNCRAFLVRTHSAQSVRLDTMLRAVLALSRVLPVLDWLAIQE